MRALSALLITLLTLIGGLTLAASAQANVNVTSAAPTGSTDAGAYSNYTLGLDFDGSEQPKSVDIDFPKGQLGALANATTCADATWQADNCPSSSQIGSFSSDVKAILGITLTASGGVYRLPTVGTEVGRFGITAASGLSKTLYIVGTFRLRTDGSYGLHASVPTIPNQATVTIFGIPSGNTAITMQNMTLNILGRLGDGSNKGFFFNPSECVLANTTAAITTYAGGSSSDAAGYTPTNCATEPFNPSISFGPASSAASSPAKFNITVSQPYTATDARIGAPFRNVTATLPAGVQLTGATNTDNALKTCSDAQFNLSSTVPDTCPPGSIIGSVTMDSPLVGVISGNVYLSTPSTGPNDLVRVMIMAQQTGASDGLRVKLLGSVSVDPTTGLMVTTLTNLPAQPVKSFSFTFRDGSAPALRQPRLCGTPSGSASLQPFSSTTAVTRTGTYQVSTNCPTAGTFRPTIGMVTSPTTAGAPTTGVTTINLPVGDEAFTSVKASLPPGMIANIAGVPHCSSAQFAANTCPSASQIGTVADIAGQVVPGGSFSGSIYLADAPDSSSIAGLYIDVPVIVGPITIGDLKITSSLQLRTDFGVDVVSTIPDSIRGLQLDQQQLKLTFNAPNFLVNPPVCSGNSITGAFGSAQGSSATNTSAVSITGCATTAFAPTLAFSAGTASAGGPSSFTTTVGLPASTSAVPQSAPKKISVTLPSGVSLSPSANSDGALGACSDAQFTINDFADPTCPSSSAVGSVTIQTPSVGALTGTAYLGTAPTGHTARVLLDAKSTTYGSLARVKLEGDLDVNATTGDVTAVFDNLPPVQFTSFSLTLRGGTSPVLSMPRTCGTTSGSSSMTAQAGAIATPSASLTINVNCADATTFAPTFSNVITPTKAGANTTMTTTIGVPERNRTLNNIAMNLPAGLLANVAGAARCTITQANASACPAGTKIGTVTALAGQGTVPGTFTGSLYLTDAPNAADVVGIAVDLPAVVGPVDLGHVVTIADVKLRPADYGIDVNATVPTSQKGVPLYLRSLTLAINASGFLTNPETCGAAKTTATLSGTGGSTSVLTDSYTPTGCAQLGFNPTVGFSASPAAAAGPSAFTASITAPASSPGSEQAALKTAVVDLPTGVALSSSINSDGALVGCTDAQFSLSDFSDPTCGAGSVLGTSSITVPQVGAMTGKVYLAQTTPTGAIAGLFLDAKSATFNGVRVKLAGRIDVDATTGKTTATFDNAPAVAFTTFSLTLRGGNNPAVSMPRTCGTPSGTATLTSQNGATATSNASLNVNANCADAATFNATGSVALSTLNAGADTSLTTTVNVPTDNRELAKLAISLPAGLLARIQGLARCSVTDANAGACAAGTAIGTISAVAGQGTVGGTFNGTAYLVDAPNAGDIVGIGLSIPVVVGPITLGTVNVVADVKLRSDYGIDITANVPTQIKGIPMYLQQLKIAITKSGFLFNPSTCGTKTSTIAMTSASYAGTTSTANASSSATIANCAALAFAPTVGFSATPASAGGAAAFTTAISLPSASPQSALKNATVTLPTGVSLSPSLNSDGALTGCTDTDFNLSDTTTSPACVASSKIGTTTINTTSIGTLTGQVYLAATAPGHTARIFVHAQGVAYPTVHVKLVGVVDVDPATGVATATFTNAPEVPFTEFDVTFQGGTTPALSMPRTCGTPAGSANFSPHSGSAAVVANASLTINVNCADATTFAPTMTTAISPTKAGANSSLTTTITVPERNRFLDHLVLNLPGGLLANINGAPRCSIAAANSSTCAANTKIGTVTALAGQGTVPGTFTGSLYLTDSPEPGDVVGIAVDLPAVVGPVDLGHVITIADVTLRPSDYGIDVTANVPTDVKGIPLNLRQLTLNVNQAGFLTNPASCSASTITSTLHGVGGSTANPSAPFTATGCAQLGFNPSVSFSGSPSAAGGASAFTTKITAPASAPGTEQAALKTAVVDLPTGVSLSPSINSDSALAGCTDAQFAQTSFADPTCASGSAIGTARIDVPQVGTMTGNVYLAQATPSGAIAGLFLDAKSATFDGVRVKLAGRVDVDATTLKATATFDNAPAVAFTDFELTLRGGTAPAVSMPRTCGTPTGTATLTPQTGSAVTRTGTLTVDQNCGLANTFATSGAVALGTTAAGQNTSLTTTINVPAANQELAKLAISLPAGLLANIDGAPRCTVAAANAGTCAANTQIGTIDASAGQGTTPGVFSGKAYLVDAPNASDIVGIGLSIPVTVGPVNLGSVNVIADVKLRSDYGIDISAAVPTQVKGIPMYLRQLKIAITKSGFLFNPSTCGDKTTTMTMTSNGSTPIVTTAPPLTTTIDSCGSLAFTPSLAFSATPASAGGASAFTTKITLPATAQSALKSATVQLPTGLSLSPSIDSAGTLTGCTDAQFGVSDPSTATTCPAASKIGSTVIVTSSVGELDGDVYLAATGSGHLARVLVDAGSATYPGARVKMAGTVDVDPSTGLTTAVFDNAPPVPFTSFAVTFQGGTAPAITMPRVCGTPGGSASLQSFAGGALVSQTATLTINANCASSGAFAPTAAVTVSPTSAAAATTLTTDIQVPAANQELSRVRLSLPSGLVAKIDGHPTCTIVDANAGDCAANTKIGTITAKAGQGTAPATFGGGSVYLTDAPNASSLVGLAVKLPVQVGSVSGSPIVDLGNVTAVGSITLRQDYGIDIDVPVPTSVKGIPMVVRDLNLSINESGFMVNPPTCTGNAVTGTLDSAQGTSVPVSTSLAVSGCATANFDAGVSFSATPKAPGTPAAFTTTLTVPATGDNAPLGKAVVTLPTGTSLSASVGAAGDPAGCTDAQFDATTWNDPTCPASSDIGTVSIATPSVGAITGDAYLAQTAPAGAIARVLIDAKSTSYGAKARIKLAGVITVDPNTGATTATFDNLPPVAFSSFALTLRGGAAPVISLPRTCDTFAGSAVLTPAAGAAVTRTGSLTLNTSCPDPNQFGPKVALDLSPAKAGASGTLTTTIRVPGGDQELSHVKIGMPAGLTAKLGGAARCSIADAMNDACDPSTSLGTVAAQVGVPGAPYTVNGQIYLTDGRSGNVAGIAIVLPAKVGPIDLGKVITIADVQLRSPDLALQITADVPTQVKGVRLDIRQLVLTISKPGFIVNPSSCGTLPGTAAFTSTGNQTASDSGSITVDAGSCADQSFDPQVSFSAGNPKPGEASDFTTSVAIAGTPSAPASPFKTVDIKLPAGMSLSASAGARGDLAGCADDQFHQDDLTVASTCPAGSQIGTARFQTDLVGDLVGNAYLAPATSGNLARVFIETTASDVPNLTVRLIGKVQVDPNTGETHAVFDSVPAIPVTNFSVTFRGGNAPALALPRTCGTATGGGTFVPVNGTATQTRTADLALSTTDCPDPSAFTPTSSLTRSTTAAGQSMTFTTTIDVPAKQQELSSLNMVLPAGLLGTISSVPACSVADANASRCDQSSKVGDVTAQVGVASAPFTVNGAAYLVKGDSDSIARLAIDLPAQVGPIDLGHVVTLADLKLRGDYGLTISAPSIPTTVKGVRLDLHHLALAINRSGFMVNPVSCSPATSSTTLGSAQGGSVMNQAALNTDSCDQLQLNASIGYQASPASPLTSSAVTTSIKASAASGAPLDAMKTVRVTMPEGLSLSPSAGARGDLAECSAADFNAGDITTDASCPDGSDIGTVTISSPMVGTLTGDAYLGAKTDGHFAGIFLQAKAADYPSLRVKLPGTLDVDATTGRLTAVFDNLPQVQVSGIDLALRGGDAPVLSLPRTCGQFGSAVNIARYGGASSDATGQLTLDQDCPDPNAFGPALGLALSSTQAGSDTALSATIDVPARQQELSSLDMQLPPGLLGRLTVAPKCAVADAQANSCAAASVIGHVSAKVGVATAPFSVSGNVYLTDGFDGSIAGLMFALPAKVGPIDLGNVVTMAQIKLTGNDLRLGITAAQIPTRVQGIPLNISQLAIGIDKPGMIVNATTCGNQSIAASYGSAQGGSATGSAPYAATGCGNLNWQPTLKMSFSGSATDMKALGHPTVSAVVNQTEGQGNLRAANVTLPDGIAVDLKNVNARQCASTDNAVAGSCPATSQIGNAVITTSALPNPVNATIFMVKVPGQTLPGLDIHVRDQISLDIIGSTKLSNGRIVANFDGLPDTPISEMALVFTGGSTGVLQLGKEICGVPGLSTLGVLTSQNGLQRSMTQPVSCNGSAASLSTQPATTAAFSSVTFKPSGGSSGLTFALSNPNGISRIVLRMPKGAIFQPKASKLIKLKLTGAKAKAVIVNGQRRLAISIRPIVAGTLVTKVKFTLPKKAIKINYKIRRVLTDKKTSKAKKKKLLAKLLKPSVTMTDGKGTATAVKITTKITAK